MDELYKPKMWRCATCGTEKKATAHQLRRKNCSKECMAVAYKSQLVGIKNPNYKNAHEKRCLCCNQSFFSYVKTRKYCSFNCYQKTKKNIKPAKKITNKKEPNKKICRYCGVLFVSQPSHRKNTCSENCRVKQRQTKYIFQNCLQCGKNFRFYKSQKRIYCSYQCHLDSGGSFRAGIAAAEAILKYGPKKDANHNEVINELRKYCAVYDLSKAGMGIPDGIAWIKNAWHLFDIKNPKTGYGRRGLNEVQKKWIGMWQGGPVYLIYTVEEAAQFGIGNFEGIKCVQGGYSADATPLNKE